MEEEHYLSTHNVAVLRGLEAAVVKLELLVNFRASGTLNVSSEANTDSGSSK